MSSDSTLQSDVASNNHSSTRVEYHTQHTLFKIRNNIVADENPETS